MPPLSPDATTPALDLLRAIAVRGVDGAPHRTLFGDAVPAHVVSRLLDALRSRGYVTFDPVTGRWVATADGRRRAVEAQRVPPALPRG